ncbi:MAG TPA: UbiX family flavin prenyltransferase [Oligoflexia bacterium]|nr:UbiX family flavin prenyltransferase [Oligoflexia bacterium]HMP27863.1 UbiX family flavin prenyltransferase [Oligoflexia bacterium]
MNKSKQNNSRWIVGVTGASGMQYAIATIKELAKNVGEVMVIVSEAGHRVLAEELDIKLSASSLSAKNLLGEDFSNVFFLNPRDWGASVASGSFIFEGMIVVPCSMSTLACIANGINQNLIHRAADVTLKESRRLVVVPRETPLSQVHLRNMLTLAENGAIVVPAMPGFYSLPKNIDELVLAMALKILDAAGIEHTLSGRWQE